MRLPGTVKGVVDVGLIDPAALVDPGDEVAEFLRPFRGCHCGVAADRTVVIDPHESSIGAPDPSRAGTKVPNRPAEDSGARRADHR